MPKTNSSSNAANAISPMVEIDFSSIKCPESALKITEHAFFGHINIRGSLDDSAFVKAAKKIIGVDLLSAANTFIEYDRKTILWLGPNEWLVVCPQDVVAEIIGALRANLGDTFASITDVSGGNTILELSGDKAQSLLLKGTPLDLHHSEFSTGQCAQTVIAKTGMTLWQVADDPVYKLIVRRSFSDYLGLWLLDAAREYQEH